MFYKCNSINSNPIIDYVSKFIKLHSNKKIKNITIKNSGFLVGSSRFKQPNIKKCGVKRRKWRLQERVLGREMGNLKALGRRK
jgi:hypothetical protein